MFTEYCTWTLGSGRSRSALGSGVVAFPWFCRELNELFTLPPGVEVWVWGPGRLFSTSRRAPPLAAAGAGAAGPCDEVISLVAGGSAFVCCLFFLPKRKDMAPIQASEQCTGRWCQSSTHSAGDGSGVRPSGSCARKGGWEQMRTVGAQEGSGVVMDGERWAHVAGISSGRRALRAVTGLDVCCERRRRR